MDRVLQDYHNSGLNDVEISLPFLSSLSFSHLDATFWSLCLSINSLRTPISPLPPTKKGEWDLYMRRKWEQEGPRAQGTPSPTIVVCSENQKGEIVTNSIRDREGAGRSPWSEQNPNPQIFFSSLPSRTFFWFCFVSFLFSFSLFNLVLIKMEE